MFFKIRWDMNAKKSLPDYIKPLYEALLSTLKDFEEELSLEGNAYRASFMQQAVRIIHIYAYMKQINYGSCCVYHNTIGVVYVMADEKYMHGIF